ncbi:MAG: DUF4089 domain-containing protein [Leptolyngbyaceae cyanobacterium SL_7_1]|nr:DUF4089 domain-containing protein [Leptolyngbyaceae cyanobacterium SL_7_1]
MCGATAFLLGFNLDPDSRSGVIDNLARTAAIAQLVLDFPLPVDLESAPTFEP